MRTIRLSRPRISRFNSCNLWGIWLVMAEGTSALDTGPGRICMDAKQTYMSGQKKATTTETTRPAKVGPMTQER